MPSTLGSFLIMASGKAVIVVAFAIAICPWFGYVYTSLGYRPKSWLTAYGETLHCQAVQKPGAEMDIVADRTGFVPDLEPGKVGLGHNLLLLLAVLMNGALIFLVAWFPVREPASAEESE